MRTFTEIAIIIPTAISVRNFLLNGQDIISRHTTLKTTGASSVIQSYLVSGPDKIFKPILLNLNYYRIEKSYLDRRHILSLYNVMSDEEKNDEL